MHDKVLSVGKQQTQRIEVTWSGLTKKSESGKTAARLNDKILFLTLETTMNHAKILNNRYLFATMLAIALSHGSPAAAAAPDFTFVFPAGIACNFDLQVEGTGGNRHFKEFRDENDNVVRSLDAGTGSALRFTNLLTGSAFSTKSNGAVAHKTFNPDGSYTEKDTGHNVLILSPPDNPSGPTTTLTAGRVVYTVDTEGIYTLLDVSGKTTDICASLP